MLECWNLVGNCWKPFGVTRQLDNSNVDHHQKSVWCGKIMPWFLSDLFRTFYHLLSVFQKLWYPNVALYTNNSSYRVTKLRSMETDRRSALSVPSTILGTLHESASFCSSNRTLAGHEWQRAFCWHEGWHPEDKVSINTALEMREADCLCHKSLQGVSKSKEVVLDSALSQQQTVPATTCLLVLWLLLFPCWASNPNTASLVKHSEGG